MRNFSTMSRIFSLLILLGSTCSCIARVEGQTPQQNVVMQLVNMGFNIQMTEDVVSKFIKKYKRGQLEDKALNKLSEKLAQEGVELDEPEAKLISKLPDKFLKNFILNSEDFTLDQINVQATIGTEVQTIYEAKGKQGLVEFFKTQVVDDYEKIKDVMPNVKEGDVSYENFAQWSHDMGLMNQEQYSKFMNAPDALQAAEVSSELTVGGAGELGLAGEEADVAATAVTSMFETIGEFFLMAL